MERITTPDGLLIGHEGKTCRDICDRTMFCCDCPISKALKKLAEYENKESEIWDISIRSDEKKRTGR